MNATCPLCRTTGQDILWSDAFCRVVLVGDADYPGYCRVILNAHVKEMTDLPPVERDRLMGVVYAVETAVREVVGPDKVNLACLGNVVPHLHWHVIPRFTSDRHFPAAIWSTADKPAATSLPPADLRPGLTAALAAGLQRQP